MTLICVSYPCLASTLYSLRKIKELSKNRRRKPKIREKKPKKKQAKQSNIKFYDFPCAGHAPSVRLRQFSSKYLEYDADAFLCDFKQFICNFYDLT